MVGNELRIAVSRYLTGETGLEDLRRWRRANLQGIHDSGDATAEQLEGVLALLLAEYSIGDRNEASLRSALASACEASPVTAAR